MSVWSERYKATVITFKSASESTHTFSSLEKNIKAFYGDQIHLVI